MKCERCGHELDNDDLFCSKCGKAVFEEYMDEDDIWEFYKSDEELKAMKMEAAAAADKDTEDSAHNVAAAAAAGYESLIKPMFPRIRGRGMVPGMWMRKRQMR